MHRQQGVVANHGGNIISGIQQGEGRLIAVLVLHGDTDHAAGAVAQGQSGQFCHLALITKDAHRLFIAGHEAHAALLGHGIHRRQTHQTTTAAAIYHTGQVVFRVHTGSVICGNTQCFHPPRSSKSKNAVSS